MKSQNKALILTKVLSAIRSTLTGGQKVFNSGLFKYSELNIWSRVLEAARNLNLPSVNSIELVSNQSSRRKASPTEVLATLIKVNKILTKEVIPHWYELPEKTQLRLEELAQMLSYSVNSLGSWKSYPLAVQLDLLQVLVVRRKNLVSSYRQSAIELINAVLEAQSKIVLSNRDRDSVLDAIENPPELSEALKLGIRQFKEKYKI